MTARTTLRRRVPARLIPATNVPAAGWHQVRVALTYRVSDVFAVAVEIPTTSGPVTWLLSRELLAEGLDACCGIGDVQVYPDLLDDTATWIELRDPSGRIGPALLRFCRADLERFLDNTDAMVPAGTEATRINWTRELDLLAGGEVA
ncbi:SsgA family sporulation/cell division regulator [Amycolatopsis sp. NPDC048633]|uniref:SsgA family sporulation/cell division regulator n=1 Tax=Amycolatopsis sp. NPDC048633 TaxID=3157095 RepID=UPI0033D8C3A7